MAPMAPPAHARQRWRLLAVPLVAGVCLQGLERTFVLLRSTATRSGSALVEQPRWVPAKARGPEPMRLGPGGGSDPVNNVSPEMQSSSNMYVNRYEDIYTGGQRLWANMLKDDKVPKKLYFIGHTGNGGHAVAEQMAEVLAYVQAPDGTPFVRRKPGVKYPSLKFFLTDSDREVAQKSPIAAVDLFMEDEKKYRELETAALKEFDEKDCGPYPAAMVVGDTALANPENVEIVKKGLVIWLDVDLEYAWSRTQFRPKQGGGLAIPRDLSSRPAVWCIANGWDGDVDDSEGKSEYKDIAFAHREMYEKVANIRIRGDVPGIVENPLWAAERLNKAIAQHFGIQEEEGSIEEEVMEKDLDKFLESARLSKYLKPAMAWCEKQGAASIEDIVENILDFAEALDLKPLETKRLQKAAASVQASLA